MAFEDYKNLDVEPETATEKELEELRKKYGIEIEPTSRIIKEVNAKNK